MSGYDHDRFRSPRAAALLKLGGNDLPDRLLRSFRSPRAAALLKQPQFRGIRRPVAMDVSAAHGLRPY